MKKSKFKFGLSILAVMLVVLMVGCSSGGKDSVEGKLALDYVNNFLNATDVEAKKKFVTDNVHADAQALFGLVAGKVTEENQQFKNPSVIEVVEEESDGKKGNLVLLKGEMNSKPTEMIVAVMDKKVLIGFVSNPDNPDLNKMFEEARSKFKAEPLK